MRGAGDARLLRMECHRTGRPEGGPEDIAVQLRHHCLSLVIDRAGCRTDAAMSALCSLRSLRKGSQTS